MTPFDLVAARLEAAKRDALNELNRELFAIGEARPVPPPSRLSRLLLRARRYFGTLGRALRGDDPYDTDYDW